MLTNDEMSVAMSAARDLVLALIRDHEKKAHAGRECLGNRASAVAYLGHCLGLGQVDGSWRYAGQLLGEYDDHCIDPNCVHHGWARYD